MKRELITANPEKIRFLQVIPASVLTAKVKKLLLFTIMSVLTSLIASAQQYRTAHSQNYCNPHVRTFYGINLGHALAVSTSSKIMNKNVLYVPAHLVISHAMSRHFGLTGLIMYRLEKDYNFLTHEVGFGFGPSYLSNSLKGFYADCKFGLAYAYGLNYEKKRYTRTDILIQPDVGYYKHFKNGFSLALGVGLQTLVLYKENPTRRSISDSWDWNKTSQMAHYYLPVINVSVGVML